MVRCELMDLVISVLQTEASFLLTNKIRQHSLDKLLLLKVSCQVPQLQWGNCNADTKRQNTEPRHSRIGYFTDFPHLCFPVLEEEQILVDGLHLRFKSLQVKLNTLNLIFLCNWFPILGRKSNSPIKAQSCVCNFLRVGSQPETCHIIAGLSSGKCKLTMSYIFIVMKIVPIGRCHLGRYSGRVFGVSFIDHVIIS